VRGWSGKTEIRESRLVKQIGLSRSKFYNWRDRHGKVNEHNELVPRDCWLEPGEVDAIVRFRGEHPHDGYRALTYMMMDADVAAASPSSVYRVLKRRGLLARWNRTPSKKGTGFVQPLQAHEHWHTDVTYVNVRGTFFYLASLLDGFSRYIVHWELREQMTERDIETIVQRAVEKFPDAKPRIISDNGPQFIARDFNAFIRQCGMTHVKTSPYYPQSNGKIERWHGTLKRECIRRAHRSRSTTPAGSWGNGSSITTTCGFTAPSTTSPPRTNSKAAPRPSWWPATPSSLPPANSGASSGNRCAKMAY